MTTHSDEQHPRKFGTKSTCSLKLCSLAFKRESLAFQCVGCWREKKVQENTAFDKIEQENQIQIFKDNKRANLQSNATQSSTVIY